MISQSILRTAAVLSLVVQLPNLSFWIHQLFYSQVTVVTEILVCCCGCCCCLLPMIVRIYKNKLYNMMLGFRYWSVHLTHNLSCCGYFRTRILCKECKDKWIVEICVPGLSQYYFFNTLFWSRTKRRGSRPCRGIIPLWHTLVLLGAEVYDTSGNERTRGANCRFSQRILEFAAN